MEVADHLADGDGPLVAVDNRVAALLVDVEVLECQAGSAEVDQVVPGEELLDDVVAEIRRRR